MRRTNLFLAVFLLGAALSFADDDSSPPPKKPFSLSDFMQPSAGSSDQSPSVAGVRGLEETSGPVDTKARDYAAIDKLDLVKIHDDELKKFLDDGQLQ